MIAYPSNWLILFPLAFSLYVGLRLSIGAIDFGRSTFGIVLIRLLIAIFFGFAFLAIGLRPNPISLVWIFLLAVFLVVISWKSRRLDRSAMFLSALNAKDLDQKQVIFGHFQKENVGWVRRRALAVSRDLATGIPWWGAFEIRGLAVGIYEKLLVRLHGAYGKESTLAGNYQTSAAQVEGEAERLAGRVLLFTWIVVVGALLSFIATFIMPTLKEMAEEFGLALPQGLVFFIQVADFLVDTNLVFLLGLVPLALMMFAMLLTILWIFPSMLQLPVFRWFAKSYFENAAFSTLAAVLPNESNLLAACRATGNLIPVVHLSERYHATAELIEQGAEPQKAFLRTGLINNQELAVFGQTMDHSEPLWGLRELANWRTERMLHRYSILVQIAFVLFTLILAAIVGLVAVSMIAFLSSMINALA